MGDGPGLPPLRVAPGGRYFETGAGAHAAPFFFIGQNDAVTWPGLAGLYRRRDVPAAEAYLSELADSGVTVLRLMLEYAHREGRYFERPVGTFNPAMVRLWDDLFALCGRLGLRVLLAPWDNFWMAHRWHRHPYNTANGGPAGAPASFFTDEATIQATVQRLTFAARRWSGSGVLAAWDLFNEIHPYWGGTPVQQAAVIGRLSEAVREAEHAAWGLARPQTVSVFGPSPAPEYEDLIFRHPHLDFATTHIYEGPINDPRDTVTPALAMAAWTRHALARVPVGRPFVDSEHGPIHLFNDKKRTLPEPFDDEYERHLMWAHLASGGAGSGLRWPARHPHVLTPGMRIALRSLAAFTRHVDGLLDWRRFAPQPIEDRVRVAAPGVCTIACGDDRRALVWLVRGLSPNGAGHQSDTGGSSRKRGVALPAMLPERDPLCDVPVVVRELAPGAYRVVVWDTGAGRPLAALRSEAGSGGALRVVLPVLGNDLALAIGPADELPLSPTTVNAM